MNKNDLHFFLGGADLEMATIKNLLKKEGVAYSDAGLAWGASTSKYGDEIEKVAKEGKTPVIIELAVDSKLPDNVINVDHHNENASRPASILQVCELLGVKPTREMQLVAANDSGYIPAMLAKGATKEEINAIRYKDRACQGITPEQEKQAEEAIAGAREVCGVTVIKMAHSKTATVTDRLFDPDKKQNILIITPSNGDSYEVNYFGPEGICRGAQREYEEYEDRYRWMGGFHDGIGYWGIGRSRENDSGETIENFNAEANKVIIGATNFILTQNQEKQKGSKTLDPKVLAALQDGLSK